MKDIYRKFFGHQLVPFALILLVLGSGMAAAVQTDENAQSRDFGKLVIKAGDCSGHALALKPDGVSKEIRSSAQMHLADDGEFMYSIINLTHQTPGILPFIQISSGALHYFLLYRVIRR